MSYNIHLWLHTGTTYTVHTHTPASVNLVIVVTLYLIYVTACYTSVIIQQIPLYVYMFLFYTNAVCINGVDDWFVNILALKPIY